jgi:hypothetical protein
MYSCGVGLGLVHSAVSTVGVSCAVKYTDEQKMLFVDNFIKRKKCIHDGIFLVKINIKVCTCSRISVRHSDNTQFEPKKIFSLGKEAVSLKCSLTKILKFYFPEYH